MKTLLFYDSTSGKVCRIVSLQDVIADEEKAPAGQDKIELTENVSDIESVYMDPVTLTITSKQGMTPDIVTAAGEVTISNIPDPCTVIWNGQAGVVTGGTTTITFDEPGTKYLILRDHPKFLDHNLEVEIP